MFLTCGFRSTRRAESYSTLSPSTILPSSGWKMPAMDRSVIDLPHPDAPSMPTRRPDRLKCMSSVKLGNFFFMSTDKLICMFYHFSTFFMAFDEITFIRTIAANAITSTIATHTPAVR